MNLSFPLDKEGLYCRSASLKMRQYLSGSLGIGSSVVATDVSSI